VRKRAAHSDELLARLHAALAARSALEWEALFGEDVPCAAARKVEDMFEHPQVQAGEMIHAAAPVLGSYRGITRPIVFGRTPGRSLRRAGVRPGHRLGPRPRRRRRRHADLEPAMTRSKLAQLRELSVVVADTGDYDAIKRLRPVDCTTNPTLVRKALDLPVYAG
jgi:hypothetical protein